ncbi:MAG TPA: sigma-70 family RNA polymerase sigma factor [Mycobacteriales bacterium]|jgi:RNA polymerase sigma factor (sigma-70 family)|nr:sigma-70 family RNA polymerase sigma factor [Mycobacteriales bacterium]
MTQHCAVTVREAMAGDEQAWEDLVTQYGGLLRAVARRFRLTDEQAADAAQITWTRLVENIGKVREPEKLPGWLACTMSRECIRLVNGRRHEQLTDDWSRSRSGQDQAPDEPVLVAERNAELWSAVDRLPARQREVIRALAVEPPPSYEQVGAALSVAVGSIGPTRQRALRRLRGYLAETGTAQTQDDLALAGGRGGGPC